jgi:hypothetical protein
MVDIYMLQIDIHTVLYIVSGGLATDRDILIVVDMIQYVYRQWWTRFRYCKDILSVVDMLHIKGTATKRSIT